MAITNTRPYVDGWLGNERELTVIPQPLFPFKNNPTPDTYTRQYRRVYNVSPRLYVPKTMLRTTWANLLLRSEEFDNAAWTKTNLSATANTGTAPDGQTTLDKLLETVTNAEHSVAQAATVSAAATEAFVFVVAGLGRDWVKLSFVDSAAASFSAFFNVTSGFVGTVGASTTGAIVGLGNGQLQCVLRFTPAAGAGTFKVNVASSASSISYAGDVAKGVYLWGAQVATGTAAAYVSTTDASRSVSAPNRDRLDPMAYLLTEDDPASQTSESELVTRLFGRIPLAQTVPGSLWVVKPALTGNFPQIIGSSLVMQPDSTQASYQFFTRKTVSYETGSAAGSYPTGGTYTVTIGASTTAAIAFNAVAATLQTALNALTSVSNRGSVTVTGDYQVGFQVTFATYAAMTCDTSLLLPSATPVKQIVATTMGDPLAVQPAQQQFLSLALTVGPPWGGATITGGTIALTFFGQTTAAIPYNDTLANFTSAITGLSKVGATGTTISIPNGTPPGSWGPKPLRADARVLQLFVVLNVPAFSISGASLTPTGSAATVAVVASGNAVYSLKFTGVAGTSRILSSVAHGIAATDTIYVKLGSTYYTLAPGTFDVPDSNTITLGVSSGLLFSAGTITEVGKLASVYTAGSVLSRCKRISTFYLPGVSVGIATIDDIPQPALQSDPASLVAAILAGTTSINWEVGELAQWQQTPVMFRVVTTINPAGL